MSDPGQRWPPPPSGPPPGRWGPPSNRPPGQPWPPPSGGPTPPGNGAGGWGPAGGGGGPGGPPPAPPRRPVGGSRSAIWAIAIVAVVLILARTHRISSQEIILFCVIVPSIILHEVSHGVVALAFGDDTAKRAGRLSLNPLVHVDLIGTIIVPALMALGGYGFFGWAKPVPVNVSRLRHPRNEGVLVSLAGPLTNVVLAVVAGLLFRAVGGLHSVDAAGFTSLVPEILFFLGLANVVLAAFNMIPIPPLDGSVLLERLLPRAWWPGYLRIRQYTMPLVLLIVVVNFYLNPGPITWLFEQIQTWWLHVLGF
ncbi:MAG: site-2 protease family protein [Acidimicrobiales bacterium]